MSISRNVIRLVLAVLAMAFFAPVSLADEGGAKAQATTQAQTHANPQDVASIDAIVGAIYEVVSGPAGPRDWVRMRSLFVPDGRLAVRSPQAPDGIIFLTLDDYENRAGGQFMKTGFFEHAIHNNIVQYDGIAHVFSTYESRHAADDAEPFARGINSFQLLHHNDRWWVVSIYWQSETKDAPIPTRFLPQK